MISQECADKVNAEPEWPCAQSQQGIDQRLCAAHFDRPLQSDQATCIQDEQREHDAHPKSYAEICRRWLLCGQGEPGKSIEANEYIECSWTIRFGHWRH